MKLEKVTAREKAEIIDKLTDIVLGYSDIAVALKPNSRVKSKQGMYFEVRLDEGIDLVDFEDDVERSLIKIDNVFMGLITFRYKLDWDDEKHEKYAEENGYIESVKYIIKFSIKEEDIYKRPDMDMDETDSVEVIQEQTGICFLLDSLMPLKEFKKLNYKEFKVKQTKVKSPRNEPKTKQESVKLKMTENGFKVELSDDINDLFSDMFKALTLTNDNEVCNCDNCRG